MTDLAQRNEIFSKFSRSYVQYVTTGETVWYLQRSRVVNVRVDVVNLVDQDLNADSAATKTSARWGRSSRHGHNSPRAAAAAASL